MSVFSVFKNCFNEISRLLQGNFKGVSIKLQGCLQKASRLFEECFMGVSGIFDALRKLQGCLKIATKLLKRKF